MIRQIQYAWSKNGMEGMYRFQIVSASKGCLDRNDQQVKTALSLCRYDIPKDTGSTKYPVSFGWVDISGTRFAFYRKFQEKDQAKCPGNFSAHIIFGPRHELNAGVLLRSFGTKFWWVHSPDDLAYELPELSPDCIPQVYYEETKAYYPGRMLQELSRGNKSIEMHLAPYDAVWSLHTLYRSLPCLVDSISFSTYESPETCRQFHIYCPDKTKHDRRPEGLDRLIEFALEHPVVSCFIEKKALDWKPTRYPLSTILEELLLMADIYSGSAIDIERVMKYVMLSNPSVFKNGKPGIAQAMEMRNIMAKIYQQLHSEIY